MCIRDRVYTGGSTALPALQASSSSFELLRAVSCDPAPGRGGLPPPRTPPKAAKEEPGDPRRLAKR
eukprot:14592140-Alexandrium_andersonii.AAC.1